MNHFSISADRHWALRILASSLTLALLLCAANRVCAQIPDLPAPQAAARDNSLQQVQRLIDAGDFQQAKSALNNALKTNPDSAKTHLLLAYCLLRLNDPKASLAEYTRSAALARPDASDLQNVAKDYALLDDLPDADHWMSLSVKMDPNDPEAWYGLGRIRFTQQRFQDAADCFERALVLDPTSVKAENNLGLSYEGLNRTDAAIAAYRKAIEWQQGSAHPSEQPLLNLGIVLLHEGKLPEAEQLLTQAATLAPRDAAIREQLGHLYLQTHQFPQAQSQFEQAIAASPENPSLHFLLGRVYRAEGDEEKARAEFARSEVLSGYRSTSEKK